MIHSMPPDESKRPPPDWRKIELIEPQMIEILRRKTPTERIAMILDANQTMRALIAGRLLTDDPTMTAESVDREVARRMLDAAAHTR